MFLTRACEARSRLVLTPHTFFRHLLFPLGFAFLLTAMIFQGGMALSASSPNQPVVIVTSTPDRLAEPTLPPFPSSADKGSQVYWLNCSPCHRDRGQGLTD